jgi:hypothetical protein
MCPISERFVSFNADIQVLQVPTKQEYSLHEASASWYSDQELAKSIRELTEVTRRMNRKTLRSRDCVRGLEARTTQGFQQQRKNRINSLYSVLSEQFKQQQLDMTNPNHLRTQYFAGSIHCTKEAIDAARLDAADAQHYQEEDPQDESQSYECWFFSPSSWFSPRLKSPFMEPF